MLKAMKAKQKRPVDPLAPPRPTLLGHEKVLKDTKTEISRLEMEMLELRRRIDNAETKIRNQNQYLNQLHQFIGQLRRNS